MEQGSCRGDDPVPNRVIREYIGETGWGPMYLVRPEFLVVTLSEDKEE